MVQQRLPQQRRGDTDRIRHTHTHSSGRFAAQLTGLLDAAGIDLSTADDIPAVRYMRAKTRAADAGVKARANYGNLYALAVLCEHYIAVTRSGADYTRTPARHTELLTAMRARPHGARLQNHPLNHRLNEEYERITGEPAGPVRRDVATRHYWLNPAALTGTVASVDPIALARWVLAVVDAYIDARRERTGEWLDAAESGDIHELLTGMLADTADARAFEVAAYTVLSCFYGTPKPAGGGQRTMTLHRLGRTQANDGGIDYLLRPLGRIFQVTENATADKVRIDLDKLNDVPVTFVVKTDRPAAELVGGLHAAGLPAEQLDRVEEWITRPRLLELLTGLDEQALTHARGIVRRELRREWE